MAWSGFIVRPFGKRQVRPAQGGEPYEVDFDRVQALLIAPAMVLAGIRGGTTGEVVAAGNIREDMFQLLAHADVVVADISLHNANVFYELGARHALRQRRTFMIRYAGDEVPFDLKTDRYLEYDRADPAASVAALAAGLKATLADRERVDSPIFALLPALKPPSIKDLVPVPQGFVEALRWAEENRRVGHLVLLGQEASQLPWGAEGLRRAALALRALNAFEPARDAYEAVRTRLDRDLDADIKLGTIYQRLGDLASSDSAIERALGYPEISARERAETLALRASNAKTRWKSAWGNASGAQAGERALHSNFLTQACDDYAAAFDADLNHFYSGINALTMSRLRVELASAFPEVWTDGFDSDKDAQRALDALDAELQDLRGAVALSVQRQQRRAAADPAQQRWADCSSADVLLLRKERVPRVVAAYRRALEGGRAEYFEVVARQWQLFAALGLYGEHLAALNPLLADLGYQPAVAGQASTAPRVVLFAGHRIDDPGRAKPRFPAAMEGVARQAIHDRLLAQRALWPADTPLLGIAGGASGGDILFHEVCHELGIATELYLAMPPAEFINASVRVDGAPGWIDRFHAIRQRCEAGGRLHLLGTGADLPDWLSPLPDYSIWERNNRWMMQSALAYGADRLRLMVLWDGQAGDAPGGTQHMVDVAKAAGAGVEPLDTRALFGLA